MPLDGKEKTENIDKENLPPFVNGGMQAPLLEKEAKFPSPLRGKGQGGGGQQLSPDERQSAIDALRKQYALNQIMGNSKAVHELREKIKRISDCEVTVLITGESGTGKELAARAVHYISKRAGKPFIPVHCGALPENLFENELFGHVGGAFTGARIQQNGLVKEAEGGTLFLDEIGTISPYVQIKLLRLLQEGEYKPLGNSKTQKSDVRIITAANIDLLSLVKEGKFREDLYYRLNVASILLPPLRGRVEDIKLLTDHFVGKYAAKYSKPHVKISDNVMMKLLSYHWPGNVRELENTIQKLIVMSTDAMINIEDTDLSLYGDEDILLSQSTESIESFQIAKKRVVDTFEKRYLFMLLKDYRGDVTSAAKHAGTSRTAFWNLLKRHNISPKDFLNT